MAVLLCKRAIEPRSGLWTLPGGFMENGETTSEAAWRETQEEAGANVFVGELFSLMNLPTVRQVHLFYLAELQDLAFYPGPETEEVRLFTEKEVPWKEMAFTSTTQALKLFFRNQRKRRGANAVYPVDLPHLIYPNEARNDPV
jgi:ADP-ribose pyrophosphatase YjhB (NUDIX family)